MRSGLLRTIQFPDVLSNQLQRNISTALDTLSADDDILRVPVLALAASAAVPPGKSVVVYSGAPGGTLTLPLASAQGSSVAAVVLVANESSGAISVIPSGADTVNGAKAMSVAGGALVVLASDGAATWLAMGVTIAANSITNAQLAQMATLTIKGNNTGGTANAADLTVAQVNAILPLFTSTLNGLAPASGGSATSVLHGDGSWSPVAGPAGLTLLRRTFLTGTSLAAQAGTTFATFYLKAGGGGGGGASGSVAAAGGGAEGGELAGQTSTIPTTWSFTLGAAGTAGSSAGGNGGTGGNSTFSDGATTWTANGGPGGSGSTSSTGPNLVNGALAPAISTGTAGNYLGSGAPGNPGLELNNAGSQSLGGAGGGRGGGSARTSVGAGNAAVGPGGGGGGAVSIGSGAAGGAGKAGWGVLEEWG